MRERYAKDPVLLDFYRRRLLEPGWPGELDDVELGYLKSHLQRSNRLRTHWGFPRGERRLTEGGIKAVALWGLPDDASHNAELVRAARRTPDSGAEGETPATNEKVWAVSGTSGHPGLGRGGF